MTPKTVNSQRITAMITTTLRITPAAIRVGDRAAGPSG